VVVGIFNENRTSVAVLSDGITEEAEAILSVSMDADAGLASPQIGGTVTRLGVTYIVVAMTLERLSQEASLFLSKRTPVERSRSDSRRQF